MISQLLLRDRRTMDNLKNYMLVNQEIYEAIASNSKDNGSPDVLPRGPGGPEESTPK